MLTCGAQPRKMAAKGSSRKWEGGTKPQQKVKPSHIQTRQGRKGHAALQTDIIIRPDRTTPTITTTTTPTTTKEATAAADQRY